jgi:hypothetical protein
VFAQFPKGVCRCTKCQEGGQGWPQALFISPPSNRAVTLWSNFLRGVTVPLQWSTQWLVDWSRGHQIGGGGTAMGVAVTTQPSPPETLLFGIKWRCHQTPSGGDQAVHHHTMVVYTAVSGDHPKLVTLSPSLPSPVGHRPSVGGATGQGVVVPPRHHH